MFLGSQETNQFIRRFVQKIENTHGLFLYECVSLLISCEVVMVQ